MDADLKWIIGIGVTLSLALITTIIAAFRSLAARITSVHEKANGRIDDVKDNYVRRDDLDGHIKRLDDSLKETRKEMAENHRQLLAAVTKKE